MPSATDLRLAAAIAHALPGVELTLRQPVGPEMVVARHPAADIGPCAFRRAVAEAWRRTGDRGSNPFSRLAAVELRSELDDLGGGVVRTRTPCGREQRWIATTSDWRRVRSLLEETDGDDIVDADLHATVAPDELLDVTLVGLTMGSSGPVAMLDRMAVDIAAVLIADELVGEVTGADSRLPDAGGA